MNDVPDINSGAVELELARERTKQVNHVTTFEGLTALFSAGALYLQPTWPVAAGVVGLGAMAAVISFFIFRSR